jgi:hypothetical protein
MLGLLLWPIIGGSCLVHDKYYHLPGVHTLALTDQQSRFGSEHQNIAAVRAKPKSSASRGCFDAAAHKRVPMQWASVELKIRFTSVIWGRANGHFPNGSAN